MCARSSFDIRRRSLGLVLSTPAPPGCPGCRTGSHVVPCDSTVMAASVTQNERPAGRRLPRVLLAEDHLAMAAELAALLGTEYDVVDVVHDGQALIDTTRAIRPDVIVSDIAMPGVSGLAAADVILAVEPDCRVVFVTVIADPGVIQRARGTGALGYVLKCDAGEQLLQAVGAALNGCPFLSSTARLVMDEPADAGGSE